MRGPALPSVSSRRRNHNGLVRTIFFCLMSHEMADSAQSMIQEAGIQLQTPVTSTEATSFNHTTFGDVEQALHAIEDEQAKRMSLRNLARIEPFLSWMQDYSSVLDTFCQGFSPMAWVWVHRIYLRDIHVTNLDADMPPGTCQASCTGKTSTSCRPTTERFTCYLSWPPNTQRSSTSCSTPMNASQRSFRVFSA